MTEPRESPPTRTWVASFKVAPGAAYDKLDSILRAYRRVDKDVRERMVELCKPKAPVVKIEQLVKEAAHSVGLSKPLARCLTASYLKNTFAYQDLTARRAFTVEAAVVQTLGQLTFNERANTVNVGGAFVIPVQQYNRDPYSILRDTYATNSARTSGVLQLAALYFRRDRKDWYVDAMAERLIEISTANVTQDMDACAVMFYRNTALVTYRKDGQLTHRAIRSEKWRRLPDRLFEQFKKVHLYPPKNNHVDPKMRLLRKAFKSFNATGRLFLHTQTLEVYHSCIHCGYADAKGSTPTEHKCSHCGVIEPMYVTCGTNLFYRVVEPFNLPQSDVHHVKRYAAKTPGKVVGLVFGIGCAAWLSENGQPAIELTKWLSKNNSLASVPNVYVLASACNPIYTPALKKLLPPQTQWVSARANTTTDANRQALAPEVSSRGHRMILRDPPLDFTRMVS